MSTFIHFFKELAANLATTRHLAKAGGLNKIGRKAPAFDRGECQGLFGLGAVDEGRFVRWNLLDLLVLLDRLLLISS